MKKTSLWLIPLLALALGAAGCNGGGGEEAAAPTPGPTTGPAVPVPGPTQPKPEPGPTVVDPPQPEPGPGPTVVDPTPPTPTPAGGGDDKKEDAPPPVTGGGATIVADQDADGIPDGQDNCAFAANPDQADLNQNGEGDACDNDIDSDGTPNAKDTCPYTDSGVMTDSDSDGLGDPCDPDQDNDGIVNEQDNCPDTANTDQASTHGVTLGDACNTDFDGDKVLNDKDNCPEQANPDQQNSDWDKLGDACDAATDTTPPQVMATTPSHGTKGVALDTVFQVGFDEPMQEATFSLIGGWFTGATKTQTGPQAFSFAVNGLQPDTLYTAHVTGKDVSGNPLAYEYTWSFTTTSAPDKTKPKLTGWSPENQATNVPLNTVVTFIFDEDLDPASVTSDHVAFSRFDVAPQGGQVNTPVAVNVTYSAATHAVTIKPTEPLQPNFLHQVMLKDLTDVAGNPAPMGNIVFTTSNDEKGIDTQGPSIKGMTPADGETDIGLQSAIDVRFTEAVDTATLSATTVTMKQGATVVPLALQYHADSFTLDLVPTAPLLAKRQYTIAVSTDVTDLAGNHLTAAGQATFTTEADTTPPTVQGQSPLSGAKDVNLGTTVNAVFSETIDPATVTANSFVLTRGAEGVAAAVSVEADGKTVVLVPTAPLQENSTYTATLATAIKDSNGVALGAPVTWSFSTPKEQLKPYVVSMFPTAGMADVPVTSVITIGFNEAVDPKGITAETLVVTNADQPVAGTVSLSEDGKTLTFKPTNPLHYSSWGGKYSGVYNVVFKPTLSDLAGNPMYENQTQVATFTTVFAPPLLLLQYSPTESNVALEGKISATFSEPLDAASVTNESFRVTPFNALDHLHPGTIQVQGAEIVFTPSAPFAYNTTYRVLPTNALLSLKGASFNKGDKWLQTWTFLTHAAPPTVTTVSPAAGATEVGTIQPFIRAQFSTDMQDDSILQPGTFTVVRVADNAPIAGSLALSATVGGTTVDFTPSAPLAHSTKYRATISTQATSKQQQALAEPYSWEFTTVKDTTAPTIKDYGPVVVHDAIPVTAIITVTFDEPMDVASVTAPGAISVSARASGSKPEQSIAGALAYNEAQQTLTFTPTAPLPYNRTIDVLLGVGKKDLAGNPLAPKQWSFGTEPNPDKTAPTLKSVTPADKTTKVSIDTSVVFTMSEPLDPATCDKAQLNTYDPNSQVTTPVTSTVNCDGTTPTLTMTPAVPLQHGTTYKVYLNGGVTDLAGNMVGQSIVTTFTTALDPAGPTLTNAMVIGQSTLSDGQEVGQNFGIKAYFNHPVTAGPGAATLTVQSTKLPNGPAVGSTVPLTVQADQTVLTITNTQPLPFSTTYVLKLTSAIADAEGHAFAGKSWTLSTIGDTAPLTITSSTPTTNAENVPINGTLKIAFNKLLDPASVSASTVTLKQWTGDTVVPSTVLYNSAEQTVVITPTQALLFKTMYRLTVTMDVHDQNGGSLANATDIVFTTQSDTIAPKILTQTPKNGATDISTTNLIVVTTDEALQPIALGSSDASTQLLTVKTDDGVALAGQGSVSGSKITWKPKQSFPSATKIHWTITGTAKDLNGNALIDTVDHTFTTKSLALRVRSAYPAPSSSDVPRNQRIAVVFNQAITSADISNSTFSVAPKGGTALAGTLSLVNGMAVFVPAAPLAASTFYDVKIAHPRLTMAWTFQTGTHNDTTAPVLSQAAPAPGSTVAPAHKLLFVFSEAVDPATVTTGTIIISPSGTTQTVEGEFRRVGNAVVFAPTAPLKDGATYFVAIKNVKDLAGNLITLPTPWSFTVSDAVALPEPQAKFMGTTTVAANAALQWYFTSPPDPESVHPDTLRIMGGTGSIIPTMIDYAGTMVTLRPFAPLSVGNYSTGVTAPLQTLSGGAFPAALSAFTIGAAEQTAPTATNESGSGSSAGYPLDPKDLRIFFSEPMAAGGLNPATLPLVRADGKIIEGLVEYAYSSVFNAKPMSVRFIPRTPLEPFAKEYTLTVPVTARDLAGNPLAQATKFTVSVTATTDLDTDGKIAGDNCPTVANPTQADLDKDGIGDACDDDLDGDGKPNAGDTDQDNDTILNTADNCPLVPNQDQKDSDGDKQGDACDPTPLPPDADQDGVSDSTDNCPNMANPDQKDTDGDKLGDVCDIALGALSNLIVTPEAMALFAQDTDKDGVLDLQDNCLEKANADQKDSDQDGIGDVCDAVVGLDTDKDGVGDAVDNCPKNLNASQADTDFDGSGDACDVSTDSDSDGAPDTTDNCPFADNADQTDSNNDGKGDLCSGFRFAKTIAGLSGGYGRAGGVGTSARFGGPQVFASDGASLFIGDGSTIYRMTVGKPDLSKTPVRIWRELRSGEPAHIIVGMTLIDHTLYVATRRDSDSAYYGPTELFTFDTNDLSLVSPSNISPNEWSAPSSDLWLDRPVGMTKLSNALIVALKEGQEIALIDLKGKKTLKLLEVPDVQHATSLAHSAVTNKFYLADPKAGAVWAVDGGGAEKVAIAGLQSPLHLSIAPNSEEMLITDGKTHRIVGYNLKTKAVQVVVEGAAAAVDGTVGTSGTARAAQPQGVYSILGSAMFYFGDGPTVRLSGLGNVMTVAGNWPHVGLTSGTGTTARFHELRHVAAAPDGKTVYVIDDKGSIQYLRTITVTGSVGQYQATVAANPVALIHPVTGSNLFATDLAVVQSAALPKVFVVDTAGQLYHVDPKTKTITALVLPNADGLKQRLGRQIVFNTFGTLFSLRAEMDLPLATGSGTKHVPAAIVALTNLHKPVYAGGTYDVATSTVVTFHTATTYQRAGGDVEPVQVRPDMSNLLTFDPSTQLLVAAVTDDYPGMIYQLTVQATEGDIKYTGAPQNATTPGNPGWICTDEANAAPYFGVMTDTGLFTVGAHKSGDLALIGRHAVTQCRHIDASTGPFIISGSTEAGVKDGEGIIGGWNQPADMAFDWSAGRLYVIDEKEHVLRVLHK